MEMELKQRILVLIVLEEARDRVSPGEAPTFYVNNKKEQDSLALVMSRTLMAMAHDLENGVYMLVKH
ncbi:hypothetical protein MFMK1_002802 [Metallumcola ferriviriculae]|uniref:Uncharacterized protein n=1 Tax=Metallumcola ferriviriculae TaxID=3039180 RepID=A0AAU0URY5_9FIRM|nr:hypothetical protein MFMK1_002802 [Desulfitibacteraceae bacterium MK1]